MSDSDSSSPISLKLIPKDWWTGLRQLLVAWEGAGERELPPAQLALTLEELKEAGLHEADLRRLVLDGVICTLLETTSAQDQARVFEEVQSLAIFGRSCFHLTEAGYECLLREPYCLDQPEVQAGSPEPEWSSTLAVELGHQGICPHYDSQARALTLGGQLLRRFRQKSENQTRILEEFEAKNWSNRSRPPTLIEPQ